MFFYKLTLVKVIIWRVVTCLATIFLVSILTGLNDLKFLSMFGAIDITVKTLMHLGYERIWYTIFQRHKRAVRETQTVQGSPSNKERLP